MDGTGLEVIVVAGNFRDEAQAHDQRRWCVGVAVAPESGKFYWTQKGPPKAGKRRIFRANIHRDDQSILMSVRTDIECIFSQLPEPIDLAVEEDSGKLFWTTRGEFPRGNTVNQVSLQGLHDIAEEYKSMDGRGYEIIVQNLHEAIGLCVDSKQRHVYVADLSGAIYRFNMDGNGKNRLVEDGGSFSGIALVNP